MGFSLKSNINGSLGNQANTSDHFSGGKVLPPVWPLKANAC